jgi:hypothetical protein
VPGHGAVRTLLRTTGGQALRRTHRRALP